MKGLGQRQAEQRLERLKQGDMIYTSDCFAN